MQHTCTLHCNNLVQSRLATAADNDTRLDTRHQLHACVEALVCSAAAAAVVVASDLSQFSALQ
eukprot:2576-Heterococcus_DN1.PRE.2